MNLDFEFHSPDHVRYENDKHISGPHGGANRVIKVEPAPIYEGNYIVTIYNADGDHPLWQNNIQMAPKQMKVIENAHDKIVLRGWGNDSRGQSFSDYGLIVFLKNEKVLNCILRLHDRNVYIKYLNQKDLDTPIDAIRTTSKTPKKKRFGIFSRLFSNKQEVDTNLKNGVVVENRIDGEKAEWTYVNDIKHGPWKTYFSNGNLKEMGTLNNGMPEGDWKAYNRNGNLRATGQYKNGKQTGHWKFNDEYGNLRAEGDYEYGAQKGRWIYYDENGNIEGSEMF